MVSQCRTGVWPACKISGSGWSKSSEESSRCQPRNYAWVEEKGREGEREEWREGSFNTKKTQVVFLRNRLPIDLCQYGCLTTEVGHA